MDLFNRNGRVRAFVDNSKITEDYFPHRRWQLVTLLEEYSGFWPYQSKFKQRVLPTIHFLTIFSILLAVTSKLRVHLADSNTEMIIECSLTMAFLIGVLIKLTMAVKYQSSRRNTYERIRRQFETIVAADEAAILKKASDQGFKYTATYMCIALVFVGIFDSVPVLRAFCNYLFDSRPLEVAMPIQMDYGFDHSKYWYVIAIDFLSFVYSGFVVDFAFDLSFILQVRHVQGLFEIVGVRLNRASALAEEYDKEAMGEDVADEAYSVISSAVNLHSECLETVNLVEEAYAVNWFITLLMNTGVFGAGVHMIGLRIHDHLETFRNLCAFGLLLMHFQVVFSQGQVIIDSHAAIANVCYDCKWYNMPKKACKLLSMMMVRTSLPCMITGAKLFPLSMESFGEMLKAGLSYYTVFEA